MLDFTSLMSPRTFIRVPLIVISTLFAHGTIILSTILKPVAPQLQMRIRNAAFRRWGRQMCRLLDIRLEIEGQPPTGPFILVVNHVSYVDIMVLATCVDGAYVAKADLRSWPLLGWIFKTADTIFIDRTRKKDLLRVIDQVQASLEHRMGVLIFPEGTSGKGDEILRFKPALLQLAAAKSYPVHYATLNYRTPGHPTHEVVCWWGDASFTPHFMRLLRFSGFEATLRFGSEPITASDRKSLAGQLREAMMRDFTPMT